MAWRMSSPDSTAHVHADSNAAHAVGNPIDQRHRKLQLFGGIPACGECGTHERARADRRERELAQHGLVELDEVGARQSQRTPSRLQQPDDILRQIFFGAIDRLCHLGNMARVSR